jgi:uncharacterized protein
MNAALTVVQAFYGHVMAGNVPAAMALVADEVQVLQAASLPFGGTWTGRTGFTDMAGRIATAWPGFQLEPKAWLAEGEERVGVLARMRGRGLDMDLLELWHVRDGRIVTCQPFYFDAGLAARSAQENLT